MLEKRLRKPRLRPQSKPVQSGAFSSEPSEELIALGRIVKAHGLRGQMKVVPLTDSQDRFFTLRSVLVEASDGSVSRMDVEKVKTQDELVIVTLTGITDREQAEALVGSWISVRREDVAALGEDRYYTFDLVGMEVVSEDSSIIGTITRIEDFPANAVLVVESETEEVWIPAVREILVKADMEARRLIVRLPEGLPTYPKRKE